MLAQRHVELRPDLLPSAIALELAEDVVSPPHVGLARPTLGLRRRDQRFEPRPFRVRQIAREATALSAFSDAPRSTSLVTPPFPPGTVNHRFGFNTTIFGPGSEANEEAKNLR
jgi:hypothetical protein